MEVIGLTASYVEMLRNDPSRTQKYVFKDLFTGQIYYRYMPKTKIVSDCGFNVGDKGVLFAVKKFYQKNLSIANSSIIFSSLEEAESFYIKNVTENVSLEPSVTWSGKLKELLEGQK
ncbi:hypothetical protein [Leuconostoc lactis]|uniref:hypothetical protein n=1 Tax=Leuconostoc lactis TaxID=1246 RepID=UPI0024ADA4C8|nr:hypothetical protein [Leuconostoc lactis]MDI6495474.1 hypothetical protein [Leuconostoc lactis]